MKALVLALDNQMHDALARQFDVRGRSYCRVALGQALSADAIEGQLQLARANVVINTASLEALERNPDESLIEQLALLAAACHRLRLPLLHISSNRVFDGIDGGRHRESDPVKPASRGGALAWRMEETVRERCPQHILLRRSQLFSADGENLLTDLLSRFDQGGSVLFSNNGQGCPSHIDDFARVISGVVDQLACAANVWGTYHYCSSDPASYFQFAETVLSVVSQYRDPAQNDLCLEPSVALDSHWASPLLNCEKLRNTFGIKQLPWRAAIASTVKTIFEETSHEQS